MQLFDLKGLVAIVTGGNGGIGLGMAKGLAQAGAAVVVAGRNAAKNTEAVAALRSANPQAQPMAGEVDVTQESACEGLVRATVERYGRLDSLVNNAGSNLRKAPQDYSLDEWRFLIDTNLTSAFLCSKFAYAPMVKAGGGKMINIGSMTSIFGAPFAAVYGATKGGIVQLTRGAASAGPGQHQVNAVLPGWIDTDLTRQARKDVAGLHERVVARTTAGRCDFSIFAGTRVPGEPRGGFPHRDGHPGRWRLFFLGVRLLLSLELNRRGAERRIAEERRRAGSAGTHFARASTIHRSAAFIRPACARLDSARRGGLCDIGPQSVKPLASSGTGGLPRADRPSPTLC